MTDSRSRDERRANDEDDFPLHRVGSGKLAKHLYDRHKNDFWANLNLTLSSLSMLLFGQSISAPSLFSILFGIVGSEAGHIVLILQALNLRRIYQYHPRVFSGWYGRICVLVNAWAFGVLSLNFWDALGTRRAFSKSLKTQGITPRAGGSIGRLHYLLSMIPLFAVARRGKQLAIQRNVPYADMSQIDPSLLSMWNRTPNTLQGLHIFRGYVNEWMSMDIIKLERMPSEKAPILMYIHGGAWFLGDKMFSGLSSALRVASRGIIVCMVNYRMSPEVVWPTQILDCKRALLFVKQHAREWGGHPDHVFVSGESAGGHLSALVGCTPNLPDFQPPESPNADTSVAGALPIYGVFDLTDKKGHLKAIRASVMDLKIGVKGYFSRVVAQTPMNPANQHIFELASPLYHIQLALSGQSDSRICPYFLAHGTLDTLAAYNDSRDFYDELQNVRAKYGTWAAGESDVFVEAASGLHGFGYFPSARSHALADSMTDFIFHHSRRLDRMSGQTPTAYEM